MWRRLFASSSLPKQQQQVTVFVDGKQIRVPQSSAIIQACEQAGIDIPRFCYHKRLAIAGNCRMCLVQVEKMPKLVASCAQPVIEGMRIVTDSPAVKKAREGVMEFLLANHPLDCPVCDQGGECDLQDQAMGFGVDRSRMQFDKRAVEDKYLGPIVKTSMNRCIHCTRCVRFANEVAGVDDLGTTGRGNDMQIGTYVEKAVKSELSGNLIDLCPVGALLSRPYAFQARPWELRKCVSVDVMDGMGANIRVDSRGPRVMRILPVDNDEINEEWLADKSRYACDALSLQRLTNPLIKTTDGFKEASWLDALSLFKDKLASAKNVKGIAGDFADAESMFMMKTLLDGLKCERQLLLDQDNPNCDLSDTLLTHMQGVKIKDFEEIENLVIIGSDVRREAPLLNTRIRKNFLNRDPVISYFGPKLNGPLYDVDHVSEDFKDIQDLNTNGEEPVILVSQKALLYSSEYLKRLYQRNSLWTGSKLAVLNRNASRAAGLKIGFGSGSHQEKEEADLCILLNSDSIQDRSELNSNFVVYIGHHGERGAAMADLVLPAPCYTEKTGLYMNICGLIQSTNVAVPPPGSARNEWSIFRAVMLMLGFESGPSLDDFDLVREETLKLLRKDNPQPSNQKVCLDLDRIRMITDRKFEFPISNYYQTDVISRLSPTMAACSRELL